MPKPNRVSLKNTNKLPKAVIPVLQEHVAALKQVLGTKLVGVYVHGSAAMGGFTPEQSDLDYLAVVSSPLDASERESLAKACASLHGKAPFRKGVEMSIVEERFAGKGFRHPVPFEFHMGDNVERLLAQGKPREGEQLDPDLAGHFMYARERGVCVFGRDTSEVFAPVDRAAFDASIRNDLENAPELILKDPVYVVLNLCRALYQRKTGQLYSKQEGAELYLKNARRYCELVRRALNEYRTGQKSEYSTRELMAFAERMLKEIDGHASSTR